MSPLARMIYHTGVITLAIVWAFVWLRSPNLAPYSLQLFGVVIVAYFLVKKLNQADFWQLLPSPLSLEMSLATLAFLLVIGATGNVRSPLFPLSFVHLFFLAFSSRIATALIITLEILLFHYSLTPDPSPVELSYLVSLPLVMAFFLVAKDQYNRLFRQQQQLTEQVVATAQHVRVERIFDQVIEHWVSQMISSVAPSSGNTPQSTTPGPTPPETKATAQQLADEILDDVT
jgi:hypothetical protein